ncbi:MAG TPA: decaprenyl-phosphate phosphoribosyltransferase [Polyangiaceae bacterium]|jgi:4-hydroxybenzoate polyprenyltransferase|nr:decaprenyl-phosphate phosphoribosyltransferase [Polyangiaceae bacterium]
MPDPVESAPEATAPVSTVKRLRGVVRTVRPHQWVKNVFVLAPIVFAKEMFAPFVLSRAASAFAVFCLLAGAVYAMNDIADREADRTHPVKRWRPIASGRVPLSWAYVLCATLVVVALGWSVTLGWAFLIVALIYFGQNVWYSFQLKHVAYLDVACIAAGFVLRVMGGGYATRIQVSKYLLLCTALLALFLGFGKRRHELAAAEANAGAQRSSLESYSRQGLDVALGVTALLTIATYVAYTLNEHTRRFFHSDHLWLSTGFVVLGVWRFLHIVKHRPHAESPTQEMLHDGAFVGIVLGWIVLVMWLVYHLRPS